MRSTHRRRPGGPFGRTQRERLREMRECDVHRMRLRYATVVHRWPAATERLEVGVRIERPMRREKQLPFSPRAALRDDASHRMTRAAGRLRLWIGRIAIVDHPPLRLEAARPQLRRRESLMVA